MNNPGKYNDVQFFLMTEPTNHSSPVNSVTVTPTDLSDQSRKALSTSNGFEKAVAQAQAVNRLDDVIRSSSG